MPVLLLKLLLTPVLITLASLGGRRWGAAVGGWLVGLPLTSAPVAVILTAEHGADFAATAALGILGGAASQAAFAVAYARTASGVRQSGAVGLSCLAGAAGFAASTVMLNGVALPLLGMVAVALGALVLGLSFLATGSLSEPGDVVVRMPAWDLPARVVVATGFVVLVTGIAGAAGPRLAGLITPLPIYAAVLTVFAHRSHGATAAVATLRGLVLGLFAFVAFFAVLAAVLPRVGWAAFLPALAATAAVQAASLGRLGGTVSAAP